MSELLVFVALATITAVWLALPFVPAVQELRRNEVAPSLGIPSEDGDARHFARRFRTYVAAEEPVAVGEHVVEYGSSRSRSLRAFVAPDPLVVDRGSVIPGDVYAPNSVFGWDNAVYRGLLSDEDIALGRGSLVLRWVHGSRRLQVGPASALLGRASAGEAIRVDRDTRFGWLSAPRIEFGKRGEAPPSQRGGARDVAADAPRPARRLRSDLVLPPHSNVDEDLIVTGSLVVGRGSRIRGSLKSYGPMQVEDGVWVRGHLISRSDIIVGEDCTIGGIVVAERSVHLGALTRVGTENALSTVSAPIITVAPGAVAHGTVWARAAGRVTAERAWT